MKARLLPYGHFFLYTIEVNCEKTKFTLKAKYKSCINCYPFIFWSLLILTAASFNTFIL